VDVGSACVDKRPSLKTDVLVYIIVMIMMMMIVDIICSHFYFKGIYTNLYISKLLKYCLLDLHFS